MSWREQAACLGADPLLFDPAGDDVPSILTPRRRIESALAYCRDCPVMADCLADAIENWDSGVRGGVFLNRGRSATLPNWSHEPMRTEEEASRLQPCGTDAAFRRHRRYGEEPCWDCKEAHRDQQKASSARRRARRAAA